MGTVKISQGNSKLGAIPSVSLPSIKTCRACACRDKCYAQKLERLRPAVRNAYQHNLEVLINEPETYWREVEASVMMSRFLCLLVMRVPVRLISLGFDSLSTLTVTGVSSDHFWRIAFSSPTVIISFVNSGSLGIIPINHLLVYHL